MERKRGARARHWCFTLNPGAYNAAFPDMAADEVAAALWNRLNEAKKGMVVQLEEGEQGTSHFQGYCQFSRAVRMNTVMPGVNGHLEVAKGSPWQAADYCRKEDGRILGPWEFGEVPRRTDEKQGAMKQLAAAIDSKDSFDEVCDTYPHLMVQHHRGVEWLWRRKRMRPRSGWMTRCIWVTGPTGIGKSTFAERLANRTPSTYHKSNCDLWWGGYMGEHTTIINDIAPGVFTLPYLLGLIDRFPFLVAPKGEQCHFCSKLVIITSNWRPEEDQLLWTPALARRVERIDAQTREDLPDHQTRAVDALP